jgi:replicative DNA helicase
MVCNRDGIDILTTHGELRVGDYVYSDKGTKVKVLAVGPAINDCDRKLVLFNDVEIVCHANHEWVIYNDTRRGNMARMKSIVDTKWLENENLLYKTKGGRLRPRFLVDGVHTKNRRGIKAIEKIDPVVGRCIQVEGGIYLAGKAFVPTHNSAILLNLALNVSMMNQDATILYWAIDDHRKAILYRLVSILSDVPMKKVLNTERRTAEEQKAILDAQEILRTLTMERKLVFKDDKFGRSKSKAEAWIKETQDNTGNQILFCVDSLHNIKGGDSQDTRVKVLTSSMWLKSLVASVPCTALSTIELVKNRKEEKPNLMSVAETAKIEFDFDTIGIVWNESQGLYTNVANVGSNHRVTYSLSLPATTTIGT